ncbi:MAG: lipase [Solirubrobacterales bacterium]|nr:lipase [Solirubrobacterales bacterium]
MRSAGPLVAALDPQLARFLAKLQVKGAPSFARAGVPAARELAAGFMGLQGPPVEVGDVADHDLGGGCSVRVYAPAAAGPHPCLVWFHGGGWVVGSPDLVDRPCRAIAAAGPCVVASVGYRLAPEHPFPAAVEDAARAVDWVLAHVAALGGGGVLAGGDSAGAALAVAAARGEQRVAGLVLAYPVADLRLDHRSMTTDGTGALLTTEDLRFFYAHYAADARDPRAAPLHGALDGLPPTWLLTVGHDPLRDGGLLLADGLRRAGVPLDHVHRPELAHGVLWMAGVVEGVGDLLAAVGHHVARGAAGMRAAQRGVAPCRNTSANCSASSSALLPPSGRYQ